MFSNKVSSAFGSINFGYKQNKIVQINQIMLNLPYN